MTSNDPQEAALVQLLCEERFPKATLTALEPRLSPEAGPTLEELALLPRTVIDLKAAYLQSTINETGVDDCATRT